MPIDLIRVVHERQTTQSILLDKIDKSQGNSIGYAQKVKQPVYVPFTNPLDPNVQGYLDFVPSDEVLLAARNGTISGLASVGEVSFSVVSSALVNAPTVSAASNALNVTTITGTIFLSVSPDVTYATLTNLVGQSQTIAEGDFSSISATQIEIADADVTIGTPQAGWTVRIFANSKNSNTFVLT